MPFNFSSLPPTIQQVLLSDEYIRFLVALKDEFQLVPDQESILAQLLYDLFSKNITPAELEQNIKSRFGFDTQRTRACTKEILLNIVIPFTYYFGDYSQLYRSFGGDPEVDIMESYVALAILKLFNESLDNVVNELGSVDWEKEGEAMRELFARQFVEVLYGPDAEWKERLNSTIIALLRQLDGYNEKLLGALYENEQNIGNTSIVLGDGSTQQPTVANWIKDYLGFSGGIVSSIKIAQFMTDGVNVKKMSEVDRGVVRKLLETFATLKNFPVSLDKTPEEHWMIIPYHLVGEETKTAKELPEVPGPANAGISDQVRDAKQESGMTIAQAGSLPSVEMTVTPLEIATVTSLPRNDVFTAPAVPSVQVDYDRVIAHIMDVVALKLSDESVARVKPILSSRVRNIRNSIDTGERLKAALADGGAGLSSEDADKLLKEANSAAQAIVTGKIEEYVPRIIESQKEAQGIITETGSAIRSGMTVAESPVAPASEEVPAMTIKEVNGVPTLVEKKNGKKKEVPVVAPVIEVSKASEPLQVMPSVPAVPLSPQPEQQTAPPEPLPAVVPLPAVEMTATDTGSRIKSGMTEIPSGTASAASLPRNDVPATPPLTPSTIPPHLADAKPIPVTVRATAAVGTPKTKVADIKAPPRLVGVVDEIRALTIKDFRRLSQDPAEAAKRIYQKIQALEKESLTKKAEAIKAWKESDVYALYIEIGQVNLGVDMNRLIEERKAAGKEYLTSEEFDALLDLSEKLRF